MTLAMTSAGFVSATAMARHLCFDRAYLDKLVEMGVIERRADGKFDLDDNHRRYILHLREERKRSPKSEADADFQRAKSELIRIRIQEKQRQLIKAEEAYAMIDEMAGLFLTGLSGFAARCGGRDLLRAAPSIRRSLICGAISRQPRPSWPISTASLYWTKYDAPAMTDGEFIDRIERAELFAEQLCGVIEAIAATLLLGL